MTESSQKKSSQKQENGLLNVIINVVIPILILNQGSKRVGPLTALIVALSFPLAYGIWDIIKRKKTNAFSILGFLNVSITGGLALAGFGEIWMSLKEAAFPFLIGCFVLGSAFTKKPFIETLFLNPTLIDTDRIEKKLYEKNIRNEFHRHLRNSTIYLSFSFFFSSLINYLLAQTIFLPIDSSLDTTAKSIALNEQIASMTGQSFLVIMVPSIIALMGILWYFLHGIKKHTGLKVDELLRS